VEQQPPSRSTPPPPPTPSVPPGGSSPPKAQAAPPLTSPGMVVLICPVCSEPRAEEDRFCEECGHDYGATVAAAAPVEERGRLNGPLLWLVMLFWAGLAVGGLYFLYTALWAI
jgi:hypothetical protein